jgi:putative oxidoreductase
MEFTWLSRWQPQILALLRIVVGLLFLEHATQKFFSFPAPFPVHPLPTMLIAAGAVELVAGILITLGLFTRIAAFIASGEMAAAYFIGHFPKGFWPAVNMGEGAILYCFIFLYLAAAGPGAWSVDGARTRNAPVR